MQVLNDLDKLLDTWEKLGPYERKVLLTVANRISAGQRLHGKLVPGKKKWGYECWEEQLDAAVYSAMGLVEHTETIKKESDAPYGDTLPGNGSQ